MKNRLVLLGCIFFLFQIKPDISENERVVFTLLF